MARIGPHPELNPSQKLLRAVFGYDYRTSPPRPKVDDHAVDEVAVWEFIDEVLSDREALVLKYHFGQVGRCHTLKEIRRILPRADGRGIGVKLRKVGHIEEEALAKLRYPQSRMILHLAKGGPAELPAPAASVGLPPGNHPEPNSGQRLLTEVFGRRYDDNYHQINPALVYPAANEVDVWRLVDAVLTEREAFVLKCRCGQVGRCHTLAETASILPRADGRAIGVTVQIVRTIEAKASRKLIHPKNSKRLFCLAQGKPIDWPLVPTDEDDMAEADVEGEAEPEPEYEPEYEVEAHEATWERTLTCADCWSSLAFTSFEQKLLVSGGYAKEPKRCPRCFQASRLRVVR